MWNALAYSTVTKMTHGKCGILRIKSERINFLVWEVIKVEKTLINNYFKSFSWLLGENTRVGWIGILVISSVFKYCHIWGSPSPKQCLAKSSYSVFWGLLKHTPCGDRVLHHGGMGPFSFSSLQGLTDYHHHSSKVMTPLPGEQGNIKCNQCLRISHI